MSQDEQRIYKSEEQDDVEAHKRTSQANEEAPAEGESDDDFEAHSKRAGSHKGV